MAIDAFTTAGILFGSVAIIALVVKFARQGDEPQLSDAFSLFISCVASAIGVKLCWISVSEKALAVVQNERPYMFMAGIAITWVSIGTIAKIFKRRKKKPDDSEKKPDDSEKKPDDSEKEPDD